MFYYIEGVVSLIDGPVAVVDCGGVGYAVNTTVNSLSRVRIGEKTRFYTCTIIREDCFDIYGFATAEEKRCFVRRYIKPVRNVAGSRASKKPKEGFNT